MNRNSPREAEERRRRRLAVKDTLGSFALEGLYPSAEERELLRQYIAGEISLQDLKAKAGIK